MGNLRNLYWEKWTSWLKGKAQAWESGPLYFKSWLRHYWMRGSGQVAESGEYVNVCELSKPSPPGKKCILLTVALICTRQICIYTHIALNNEEMEGKREGEMEGRMVGGKLDGSLILLNFILWNQIPERLNHLLKLTLQISSRSRCQLQDYCLYIYPFLLNHRCFQRKDHTSLQTHNIGLYGICSTNALIMEVSQCYCKSSFYLPTICLNLYVSAPCSSRFR